LTSEGTPLRRVKFSIDSDSISIPRITSLLGIDPDGAVAIGQVPSGSMLCKPASRNTWEVVESGDDSANVDELLQRVHGRLSPIREGIRSLWNDGCTTIVTVVQYLAAGDRTGPGFSLDFRMVEFMAFVGAELDVDQYVI
jgi:uncharacterized protein YbaR (Trm112 family)